MRKIDWLPTITMAIAINLALTWVVGPVFGYWQAKQLNLSNQVVPIELDWDYSPDEEVAELECQLFERCIYINVTNTADCEVSIEITMTLLDALDNYVADASSIIPSPRQHTMMRFELGTDRIDFEYFIVEHVGCSSSPPTQISSI